MAKEKTHTLYVRGVSKEVYHSLKRLAGKSNQSVNGYMLSNLSVTTEDEIADHKELISSKIKKAKP